MNRKSNITRGTKMTKKWNSKTVLAILKSDIRKVQDSEFELNGTEVALMDIDRGPRTDHGGIDGEGWMCPTEIANVADPFYKRYEPKMKTLVSLLKKKGYSAKFYMDYGEKGHISFFIAEDKKATPEKTVGCESKKNSTLETLKKKDPKATKDLNQTDFIRMKINGLENRENLIVALAKFFDKKESWAKSRLATYEKAYGNYGANDSKLKR